MNPYRSGDRWVLTSEGRNRNARPQIWRRGFSPSSFLSLSVVEYMMLSLTRSAQLVRLAAAAWQSQVTQL
jgi:hypothetical protein